MLYNMNYPHDRRGAASLLPGPRAATGPKPRRPQQHPAPFDPEDLSRRLNVVLAERKAKSDRRRRSRAEAETGAESSGPPRPAQDAARNDAAGGAPHRNRSQRKPSDPSQNDEAYVPKVAAAQFERTTTTAETMTQQGPVHKLSRRAMKFHMAGAGGMTSTATTAEPATAAEQTKAMRKAQDEHMKVLERNQFQRDRILEEAAEADQERELRRRQHQMNSIEARLSGVRLSEDRGTGDAAKRLSGVELFKKRDSQESADGHECAELQHDVNEHRVDWTQSDEKEGDKAKTKTGSPRLRKPESLWALKGRLGSLTKHGREEKGSSRGAADGAPSATEMPKSPKSPITEFFSRLKVSH